ncbi:MAG TPA: hypothetical protein PKK00_06570 [Bacteroidales bacterium]|nr:hypothetical protein [Bacteroidales bacterium]HPS16954.1 hypothetical protein [Bacteroidales bacterium]
MKKTLLFIPLILLLFIFHNSSVAQVSSLNIGWTYARMFSPLSNLEIPMYEFNLNNPNIEKKYDMPEYFRGIYTDWRIGSPKGGMIIGWANKHAIAEAEGIAKEDTDSLYKVRNIKTRLNVLSWGGYFSLYRRIKMGITFDFGSFKVIKKVAPKDEFKNAEWVALYDKKGTGTLGMTVNISFPIKLSESLQLRFQPYAQYVFIAAPLSVETTYYTNKYFYNPSSFGINTFLSFIWGNH